MTREEAVKILKSKMDGSVDTSYEWAEAVRMAIEALKAPTKYTNTPTDTPTNAPTDLISRQDAINCCSCLHPEDCWDEIRKLPSADRPTTDCTKFLEWLKAEVLDEENWELNAVANGEVICRKFRKLGWLDVEDGYYVDTRPTGECRTCGRNADNGGVHEDGRTKCPIQEHYALLLDGYCHLYEPYDCGAKMRGIKSVNY